LSSQPPYLLSNEAAGPACAARGGVRAPKRGVEETLTQAPVSAPTERAKRKKLMRQGQKDLLIHLDSLLHVADGPRSSHKNILEAALGAAHVCPQRRMHMIDCEDVFLM
jgi:hypothetical protein